jgi:hypothetical protein
MKAVLHNRVSLRYKIEVVRNGKVVKSLPFRDYMITDSGLDSVGTKNWLPMLNYPLLGENGSPTPVRRDSGSITFTQAGTTITASSGFFVAGDTGRLFKWGTGETGAEVYLTYVSATQATASASATVSSPTIGTIWYVNTNTLLTFITGLTWSRLTNASENFTSTAVVGDTVTVTHQQTVYSSAFVANKTITEIAFNDTNANTAVFDRDIITPSVALLIGDQAKIICQLISRYSSVTPVAVGNVATGYDSSGQFQIESLAINNTLGIDSYNSGGSYGWGGGGKLLEPANSSNSIVHAVQSAITLQAYNDTTQTSRTSVQATVVQQSYGTGNRYRDYIGTFTIEQANGNIYGVSAGQGFVTLKFTTTLVKTSAQVLTFTFRKSWSRVLTN